MAATIIYYAFACVGIYLLCGFIFSIAFISKGLSVLDEGSHGTGIGFKLIIIPGCMVFWPVLLKKWIMQKPCRRLKTPTAVEPNNILHAKQIT